MVSVNRTEADGRETGATEYKVRMRDGVRLATDVYLPVDWSTGAAVLVRLPYDKRSEYVYFPEVAARFNARGYAVVVQDVRGKFGSEGATVAFLNEENDSYDTIEWVVNQEWSDGRVAMFGDSYFGFTQWAAVASGHPALRAIVPRVTSADLGTRKHRVNLDGKSRRLQTMWQATYLAEVWVDNDIYELGLDYTRRPIADIFDDAASAVGSRSAYLDLIHPHVSPLRVFPSGHPFTGRPLPVLHVAGWFDNLKDVSLTDYMTLSSRPDWAPLQYLWVDSMDHECYRLKDAPIRPDRDHVKNPDALVEHIARYVDPAADFFDVFVRGIAPADSIPRVQWHLSNGADEMRVAEKWPLPEVQNVEFHLDADGHLRLAEPGEGSTQAPDSVGWTHDPEDLVPATLVNSFAMLAEYPDESSVADRADVTVFTSDEAEADLTIAGPVSLTVEIAADGPTIDLIVKLLDVGPDGVAHLIAWGDAQVDTGDESVRFTVDMSHVAYKLPAGHRLRVQLMSSEYPAFIPNPGTGESGWTATNTRRVNVELLCSGRTLLTLPVLSAG